MNTIKIPAFLLFGLLVWQPLHSQVLVNDNFNDGNRTNGGVGQLDWYAVKAATTITMQSDNTTGPDEGVNDGTLQITPTGMFIGMLVGNFGSTTLSVGQSFVLSLDFRYITAPSTGSVFRFGLYNSNGSVTSADNNTSSGNDFGYRVQVASNAPPSFVDESGAAPDVTSGSDSTAITGGTLSNMPALGTSSHRAVLTLTRADVNTMTFGLSLNGSNLVSSGAYTDTSGAFFTFDEIAFGAGNSTNTYRIDNVNLEVIPEPSTYALLGLGLGALWILRRKKTTLQ
ncbi:MAG: PEP-CTERM sorting domain-containing protein [Blastochloris sp.]|nr:PEP-CTERM sorting domain-containing protein [Blastochloris sp.]